jgi:molybdate transport system ATP-binding protein
LALTARVATRAGAFALDVCLAVDGGSTVAVLGPNGAGKTTLLRALAGLLPLREGHVTLDGTVLDDPARRVFVPPEARPVAVVFQQYRLFPHLSVLDNVAFGLRARGVRRSPARRAAGEWLTRVGLGERAGARPGELSGGQAQRVALARALVTKPSLLLLDEPLAAADVATASDLRRDLAGMLATFPGVRLLVTHDPLEAMTLAEHLIVIEDGHVVQHGTPDEITARPRTDYVARLVGTNLYRGRAHGTHVALHDHGVTLTTAQPADGDVFAVVAPRAVALHRDRPAGTPRNVWPGTIDTIEPYADRARVRVAAALPVVAEVTAASVRALGLRRGDAVFLSLKATEIDVYPA